MTLIADIDAQIAALKKRKKAIQNACPHPPEALAESGYSGDVTDEYGSFKRRGSYRNICGLCDAMFFTDDDPTWEMKYGGK